SGLPSPPAERNAGQACALEHRHDCRGAPVLEAGRDQLPWDACRSATAESDASADALPDAMRGAQPARPDARAGKSAGPEPDVPEPDDPTLLIERPVAPISVALCTLDAAPSGARSFAVEALPAEPVPSVLSTLPPELEAVQKRNLQAMLLRALK